MLRSSPEDTLDDLNALARLFLLGGGRVTLTEWWKLDNQERAALSAAGYGLSVELAVKTGRAAQGPLEAAEVLAVLDGGATYAQAMLGEALNGVVKGLKEVRAEAERVRRVDAP